ncbi:61a05afb-86d4-495c-84da-8c73a494ed94-CDS [Sclerotinia trifoliorum]|uniref:61a05afb-86d4-495c-84da-8c73a494ed94-CDS n=1 Tax=Sclerotinia trifoliorum TaxID=28548 RepID=A0A8H2VYP2_9HELO|nr:61a05afb-86d4-495c-84da-8c73a494ed94-CDS [Sclerotinia trifoliorum]
MGGPRAMYCEEEDEETGRVLKSTRRSASVKASSKEKNKEHKERPKISTTRDRTSSKASRTNSDSGYSTGAVPTGSEISSPDMVQDVEFAKESKKSRRQSISQKRPSMTAESSRPPQTMKNKETKEHRRSLSVKTDAKPEHYGAPTPVTSRHPQTPVITQPLATTVPVRPRALTHAQTYHAGARPSSYHAASGSLSSAYPPLSGSAYFKPSHQQSQFQAPPPSPAFSNNYAVVNAPQATGYFQPHDAQPSSRSLSARFEPQQQRLSAYGIRDEPAQTPRMITGGYEREYHYSEDDYDDSYGSSVEDPISRTIMSSIRVPSGLPSRTNSSTVSESNFSKADSTHSRESHYSEVETSYNKNKTKKSRARRDSEAMPPPPLPSAKPALRRPTVEMPVYDDNLSQYSVEEYHEETPRPVQRPRRPSPHRNSISYDVSDLPREAERFKVETASKNKRRQSYYGQSTSASSTQASTSGSSGYNAKLSAATNYLEEVSGPSIPLTAEALRKEQRRQAAGSSRSTKSSDSRDLSDYRGTQTTRTTRSGGDDNVTIEVKGQATVTVGGAEIHCEDGGKIQIHRSEKIRDGSQATTSEYGQGQGHGYGPKLLDDRDRRSRLDRSDSQTTRPRMRSQHSYTRVSPRPHDRDRVPRERRESPRPSDRDRAPRERREDYEARAANWETTTTSTWI